jgi:beta-lactamase regulating signal transducer with metallopeptidase domain
MFALRGAAISITVFVMVYCALSVLIASCWRIIFRSCARLPGRRSAQVLFSLRMLPVLCAAGLTSLFAVPSFLLLEPRFVTEPVGGILVVGTLCGSAIGFWGIVNAVRSLLECSRVVRAWTRGAQQVKRVGGISVLRISGIAPAMTAAGIVQPALLLSDTAISSLTGREFQLALRHEFAHLRGRDNLKKLLLRLVEFPGMRELERSWLCASEMAADESAIAGAEDALDLASALIKLSRFRACAAPKLTTALLENPVQARVERLLAWKGHPDSFFKAPGWCILSGVVAGATVLALTYPRLLVEVHAATEWLVR